MEQRLIGEKTELAIRRKKCAGCAEGRNMKKALLAMSILLGLLGFSACGEAGSRTVYQYRETEVFQNFYVKKGGLYAGRTEALLPWRRIQRQHGPMLRRGF